MIQRKNAIVAILFLTCVAATGCSDNSMDKDAKREIDRVSIDLTRTEKERDDYKAKYEKASEQLQQLEKENADLRAKMK